MIIQMQSAGPINAAEGQVVVNVPWNIATPLGFVNSYLLAQNVTNTIPVPAGNPSIVIIQPASTNAAAYTIKGIAGDTGIVGLNTLPSVLTLSAGLANFFIFLAAQASNQQFTFTWL